MSADKITRTDDPGSGAAPGTDAAIEGLTAGGAELLEDRSTRIVGRPSHGRGGERRLVLPRRAGLSTGGALVGTFLVAALALGAAAGPLGLISGGHGHDGLRAATSAVERTAGTTGDGDVAGTDGGTQDARADGSPEPTVATEPDGVDATEPPAEPDPTEAPAGDNGGADATEAPAATEPPAKPAPEPAAIEIGVGIDNVYPAVEWSRCSVDGFIAYKVIRSTNEGVTWPLGSGDTLVAAIKEASTGRFVDRTVKSGTTYHYRVMGLRTWNGETIVACRSGVKGVTTPEPAPDPTTSPVVPPSITVGISDGGHPVIDWTACTGAEFSYYKVVRSPDATVTWPMGENDTLAGVVGPDGETIVYDGDAPAGTKLYYRVFCVRSSESGYVTVAASVVKAIETPAAEPAPDPVSLGLEVTVGGDGVVLTWQQCTSDAFHWYKIVRSTTTTNPSYLPSTDGTQLIGVIENAETTHFVDGSAPAGQTVYYRVQCLGYWNGQVVLLGQTAVSAVAIP